MEERRQEPRLSGGGAPPPREPRGEVRIFAGAAELMPAAAAEVVAALARRRASAAAAAASAGAAAAAVAAPFPSFVLAGGSTPRGLYRLLADPASPYRDRIAWEDVHFFWGDERHVPPDHPDSNFRMAREAMLDHVPAPAAHVHRIAAEEPDAGRAAAAYERQLIETFHLRADRDGPPASGAGAGASAAAADWPRFDLVLLGLGEEGHTASLFPGSPLLGEAARPGWTCGTARRPRQTRLVAAVWVEQQQTWRITLTPPVLCWAATVIFLVSGAAKAAALAAVVEGEPRPDLYPAQVVAPIDGRLLWLVDEAAAARLRSRRRD
jgi:6-phosphogluconolactonase